MKGLEQMTALEIQNRIEELTRNIQDKEWQARNEAGHAITRALGKHNADLLEKERVRLEQQLEMSEVDDLFTLLKLKELRRRLTEAGFGVVLSGRRLILKWTEKGGNPLQISAMIYSTETKPNEEDE